MTLILHGMCRDVPTFEAADKIEERMEEIKRNMSGAEKRLAKGKMSKQGEEEVIKEVEEYRKSQLDMWEYALGEKTDEPELSVLSMELLNVWDKVYSDVFRPKVEEKSGRAKKSKDSSKSMLTREELTISCVIPSGIAAEEVAALRETYLEQMKDATTQYVEAQDLDNMPNKIRNIHQQLVGKLNLFLQWSRVWMAHMPVMPMLTKTCLRMIFNRFEGIEDASREVSEIIVYS